MSSNHDAAVRLSKERIATRNLRKYRYRPHGFAYPDDRRMGPVRARAGISPEYIAEDCAEHWSAWHDGWECSWPITFSLFDCDDKLVGVFKIEREYTTTYDASKVEDSA